MTKSQRRMKKNDRTPIRKGPCLSIACFRLATLRARTSPLEIGNATESPINSLYFFFSLSRKKTLKIVQKQFDQMARCSASSVPFCLASALSCAIVISAATELTGVYRTPCHQHRFRSMVTAKHPYERPSTTCRLSAVCATVQKITNSDCSAEVCQKRNERRKSL